MNLISTNKNKTGMTIKIGRELKGESIEKRKGESNRNVNMKRRDLARR